MRGSALLLLGLGATSATLELTPDNFDKEVLSSGKAALVKFLAPWCGHCKSMKPDWDALATEFEGSSKVLIADVDCTAAGEPLCEKYGIQGFPTIKSFSPPDEDGEDYEGGRDLDALREFASSLGPACSPTTKENCSPEQLADMETLLATPKEELVAEYVGLKDAIKKADAAHDKLVEGLQAQYEASEAATTKVKSEAKPRLKVLKMALGKDTPKDATDAEDVEPPDVEDEISEDDLVKDEM